MAKRKKSGYSIQLTLPNVITFLVIGILLAGGAIGIGYYLGGKDDTSDEPTADPLATVAGSSPVLWPVMSATTRCTPTASRQTG